jgi:dolichol-phosphate mannosyltransferase
MNDCIVIIPTYNEIENIESIIRGCTVSQHKLFHVLIVDDNSLTILQTRFEMLQKEFDDCFRKQNEKKAGLGTAYVHGFKVGSRK